MDKRRITTLIVYILIVLCAVGLIVMLASDRREQQETLSAAAALEEARRPYTAELAQLKSELALLEKEQRDVERVMATVHFVFAEPDARVITEALPMLEKNGYVGMVAVSESFFPGNEGCMTTEQLDELIGKGWGVCLSAGADTDLAALYARLQAAGGYVPEAVYYPAGDCSVQAEAAAAALGIPAVLQYGAVRLTDGSGEIWIMEARGTLDEENYNAFMNALSAGSGMALTHGWQNHLETFTQNDFQSTLDFVGEHVRSGQVKVTTVADACQLREEAEAARNEGTWEERRETLLKRIEEVEHLLDNLGLQNLRQ